MKAILTIIQAVMYNLFPQELAVPVVMILKNLIPLLGIIYIRLGLYLVLGLQKLNDVMFQKIQQAKLIEPDPISWMVYYRLKKLRA